MLSPMLTIGKCSDHLISPSSYTATSAYPQSPQRTLCARMLAGLSGAKRLSVCTQGWYSSIRQRLTGLWLTRGVLLLGFWMEGSFHHPLPYPAELAVVPHAQPVRSWEDELRHQVGALAAVGHRFCLFANVVQSSGHFRRIDIGFGGFHAMHNPS